jgi:glycosyltransferase involved in cell wall biosynthesis
LAGSDRHILLIGGDGGYSGVPTYIAQLMQALSGQARFTVLSDRNSGGYDAISRLGGQHIELAGLRTSLSIPRTWRALRDLAQVIDQQKPDLIWAHARMAVLLLRVLAVAGRLRGRRMPAIALTFHGLPFGAGHRPLASAVARLIEASFLRLMPPHHLLFLSQRAADSFVQSLAARSALSRHQLHVLENCSQLDPLPPLSDRAAPVLVMTGRASFQKDHATAARIFAHLPQEFRLVLCGAGTDSARFRDRFAQASGLDPRALERRVQFLGPLPDVRPVLQQADIFLLTSRYEGMPIAALEAFEAGLPLASTDIAGMAEIIAAHPLATSFGKDQPELAAARIVALLDLWRTGPEEQALRIKTAWQPRFSFDVWRSKTIALVATLLGEPAP